MKANSLLSQQLDKPMTGVYRVLLSLFLLNLHFGDGKGFGMNLIQVLEDDRAQIVCTKALLKKYFDSGEGLSGSLLYVTITSANQYLQQYLLRALHTDDFFHWTIAVMNTRVSDAAAEFVMHEKPQSYFLVIESIDQEDLEEIFDYWKSNINWNPMAQFVVYLGSVEETEDDMSEIMIEVLLSFMSKKIYNVNIIGQSEESSYFLAKTAFPYHPDNNCGNRVISIETLDVCQYQESEDDTDSDQEYDEGEDDNDASEIEEEDEVKNEQNSIENQLHEQSEQSDGRLDINGNLNVIEDDGKLHRLVKRSQDISKENISADEENNPHVDNTTADNENTKYRIEELRRALFGDKFPIDLSGCPLAAAYRPWEPYIFEDTEQPTGIPSDSETTSNNAENSDTYEYYEDNNNYDTDDDYMTYDSDSFSPPQTNTGSNKAQLKGIEYDMIRTIGKILHIQINFQVDSPNLYHLFQKLIDGDIEMIIGGIDEDPSISQFVSSTIPYHQDDLTWCVAKAQSAHSLFNFMGTYKLGAWILIGIFILTASLNILVAQKYLGAYLSQSSSYLFTNFHVLGIILCQSIHLRSIPTCLKLSFGTVFFMGLMFSNVYQSFLVSTLTNPRALYQISHINEIYQHRMGVMGSVDNVRHLNKEGEIFRYIREQYQMCYSIEDCLKDVALKQKIAVAVSRQYSIYNPRIPRDDLYCFDRNENIYVYLVTMLVPKKFHLLHKINPVIQNIIESGHIQKWARDLDMRRRIQEEIKHARRDTQKSLTLNQIGGLFNFGGILLLGALLVFILEQFLYWLEKRYRIKRK